MLKGEFVADETLDVATLTLELAATVQWRDSRQQSKLNDPDQLVATACATVPIKPTSEMRIIAERRRIYSTVVPPNGAVNR
jgi:hypothetical protein